ncbi:hypothetical protein GCM10023220_11040 [Streptomyces ziwulingensis]|uniref:Uncharacterized protein n=1 Tax=Streptomyces ziwulingensis TaxID=1045501 RepID=A0ABP9AZ65_9ACTN
MTDPQEPQEPVEEPPPVYRRTRTFEEALLSNRLAVRLLHPPSAQQAAIQARIDAENREAARQAEAQAYYGTALPGGQGFPDEQRFTRVPRSPRYSEHNALAPPAYYSTTTPAVAHYYGTSETPASRASGASASANPVAGAAVDYRPADSGTRTSGSPADASGRERSTRSQHGRAGSERRGRGVGR